jgi:hypothetical protein
VTGGTPSPAAARGEAALRHDAVSDPALPRILRELEILRAGGLRAEVRSCPERGAAVVYRAVPVTVLGSAAGGDACEDVIVPVPPGYPAGAIDLAGLPLGSPLLPRLKGGSNTQGLLTADGRTWALASYHPHQNGGGQQWNPMRDGFHTYIDHLIAWLACQA